MHHQLPMVCVSISFASSCSFMQLLHFFLVSDETLIFFAVPPEELYATQLSQLQEMGFIDTQENIRALQASHGNVHAAVEDFWVILVSDIRWFFVCFDFSIVWCYQEE
ncbi:hypothetical protein Droror1_Dr00023493 [Drosera rotundifolia]